MPESFASTQGQRWLLDIPARFIFGYQQENATALLRKGQPLSSSAAKF